MNIDIIRHEYKLSELSKTAVNPNPVKQFETWLNEAIKACVPEPTAMSLSTVGTSGFPENRIVLLKFFDDQGFIFFTNYNSEKGKSIAANAAVGLHFFWPELERQIRISGFAEKTSPEISDNYFHSRPLNSQFAAWASGQSEEIPDRKKLIKDYELVEEKFKNMPVIRPDFWGGYCIKPVKIEFWQGRENRLHDRIVFEKRNNEWTIKRIAP